MTNAQEPFYKPENGLRAGRLHLSMRVDGAGPPSAREQSHEIIMR
jgi:hypothetical protein